jgi:hypothetical protein
MIMVADRWGQPSVRRSVIHVGSAQPKIWVPEYPANPALAMSERAKR